MDWIYCQVLAGMFYSFPSTGYVLSLLAEDLCTRLPRLRTVAGCILLGTFSSIAKVGTWAGADDRETDTILHRALPPNVLYQQYQHSVSAYTARESPGFMEYHLCWGGSLHMFGGLAGYCKVKRT
jgi:hypothetical protein